MPIYLNRETYDAVVAALLNVQPDPFSGAIEPDAIKIALGEAGDVWPDAIREDELTPCIAVAIDGSKIPQKSY